MTTKKNPAAAPYPIRDVELDQIIPNPRNIRHTVTGVDELATSIKEIGVLSNLVVAQTDTADEYVLIAGHRRYAAAQAAGLSSVPCLIRTDLTDEAAQIQAMLDENKQRSNLNDVEEGDAFQLLLDHGFTATAIASRNSTPTRYVHNRLKVAKAPESVRAKVIAKDATLDDALALEKFKSQPAIYKNLVASFATNNWAFALKRAQETASHDKAVKEAAKQRKQAIAELEAEGIRLLLTGGERDDYLAAYEDEHPGPNMRWGSLHCRPEDAHSPEVAAWYTDSAALSSLRWFRIVPDTPTAKPSTIGAATDSENAPTKPSYEEIEEAKRQSAADLRTAADCRHAFLAEIVKTRTNAASKAKDSLARDASAAAIVASTEWLDTDDLIAVATILGRTLPDDVSELDDPDQFLADELDSWTLTASLEALAVVNLVVVRIPVDNDLATRSRAWIEHHPTRDAWLRELDILGYTFSDVETRLIAERDATADGK